MSMRFGVFVPQGWRMDLTEIADPVEQYEAMTAVAKLADAGPWDSVWVYDHFHTVPEPTINTTFEAWTVSSTLARDTSRVNIGQMVGCNGYRHPALYAKIASTVDVASHGRLYAGLGAGWYEHEWKAYGYEWAEVPDRMRAFREAVEIVHKMWTEERPVFTGRHYRIDQPINEPKGVRKPHPSLWLGGGGEKVTLKLVARYADGCNFANGDPEVFRQKAAVLRQHCDTLGRDYDRIAKSTSYHLDLAEPTADTIGKLERLAEAGADYVIVYIPRVAYDHEPLLRLAEEVVPQFA
ncbi:TIGR03560 family F420-dependent LLM class oxidoreductase [Actinoplanes flavus]|uniref:TIGR03560 family F420-dependent LLM class oxidoreductase n=1 Tax=Actinoplanes flavus TaxID=2820290 RepID=A0ABS3UH00_9ACTN|nr:TIGR03560 family F420-dependent LLM class oxidoreductase [Actinoplanes flavus]MBO3738058.1 TIGR03560 family F420-dependent LLM class oxidoreductase [Actinoplanes flavus]